MKSVLVVDDEFGIAESLSDLLALSGYRTFKAWNGRLALACIEEQHLDLILLDMMMPVMDGHQMLGALQANPAWKDIPVVLMSAAAAVDAAEVARAAGFLQKPFQFEELLAVVHQLIGPS